MRVRLNIDDYLTLYPYWKPREIQREFGSLAHCEAQIRNYYRKVSYGTQHRALNALIKTRMNDRPDTISLVDWRATIASEIEIERQKVCISVWKGIKARRRVWSEDEKA